jgi:integrase
MACVRKWRGKWVVDWRDPSGKRFIETVDDKASAENRLAEVIKSDKAPASKRLSFQQYAEDWLESTAKGSIKASTYQEYRSVLENHVYPLIGKMPFAKVSRESIRHLIAAKKKDGLSQGTIKNIVAPISGIFSQALEDGKAHRNPAEKIGKLNKRDKDKPQEKINPLNRDEIKLMLAQAMTKRYLKYYPLFLCGVRTGIREGELISLKGSDIDFNGRFIHVQRNWSRGKISATKNGKDRKVDMSLQLTDVLGELLAHRRSEALRKEMLKPAAERRDPDSVANEVMESWLFQIKPGVILNDRNLRDRFNRLLTDAGLRRVRFHDLRHSFASLLLQNGESLAYVKEQMGHSSINVTVDIYGHLVPGGNRQAVDKLDDGYVSKNVSIDVSRPG